MSQMASMRHAGRVNAEAIEAGKQAMGVGVTLLEIDKVVEDYILTKGCTPVFKGYKGFPATCCLSPNDVVVHGIPNSYALKDGDMLTIDVGCSFDGWMVDSARTFVLEASIDDFFYDPETYIEKYKIQSRLAFASMCVLEGQLEAVKDGCSLLDLVLAAEHAAKRNFGSIVDPSPTLNIYPQWGGHKIGRELHMEPFIPNCIPPGLKELKRWQLEREYKNYKLKAGDVICLEPVVTFGTTDTTIDEDGWTIRSKDGSLVAHTEHCLLITETGYEILS